MYEAKNLFHKFQKELVTYLNTPKGRETLFPICKSEVLEKYPIVKVTPNSLHQMIDTNTYRAVFFSRHPFADMFINALTCCQISEENGYSVLNEKPELVIPHFLGDVYQTSKYLPFIYLDTRTYNPDANPESTSVDGWTIRNVTNESWATIRAGAATAATDNESSMDIAYLFCGSSAFNQLIRSFFLFDTSSLASSTTLFSAELGLYANTKYDDWADGSVDIVTSAPASSTAIVTADHTTLGTTLQATSINITSISTSAYNTFTLNATGIGNISRTGITKFGSRLSYDTSNTDPTFGGLSADMGINVDTAGGSNKPKLTVVYSASAGSMFFNY